VLARHNADPAIEENRMHKVTSLSGAILIAGLTLGACHHHRGAHHGRVADHDGDHDEHVDEHRDPELGSGMSTNSAVNAIARARCERERRCENVGADKSYASMGACEQKIRADWAPDLNKYECPRGTVKAELEECLNSVRAEDCGNPFDTLSRMAQCDAADICQGD
jgi:hypothetical protein